MNLLGWRAAERYGHSRRLRDEPLKLFAAAAARDPVGSYWIGLSAEGYGLHGTPNPSKVSKAESHGCVRLTNWDAVLLGTNVKKGTPVVLLTNPWPRSKGRLN
jgi:lipoprotein-anchoring transpeptidase ErfK/SrfK